MNRRITRGLISWFIVAVVAATFATGTLAAPSRQAAATVQAASNPTFGTILVNAQGMTLYTLSSEAGGNLQCTGSCLQAWPPLLLPAGVTSPTAGTGVTGTIATISRAEGTQVTDNGFPLYTFSGDTAPGQTNGDGLTLGSGTWHVVKLAAAPVATATSTSPTTAPVSGPLVQVASNATLGPILVNDQGFTLYYNTAERGTTFVCTGACLGHWPALAPPAGTTSPSAGPGITGTLGVVARPDGTQQVTYNGEPLYTFAGDSAAGQTNGEGIKAFGGVWHAAQVNNTPATVLAAAPAVPLSVRVTRTGATTWGTVTIRYRFGGRITTTTCSAGSCHLAVPGGVQIRLSEAATDTHTWPFAGWVVKTGARTHTRGGTSLALHLNRATKITARYTAVR